MATRGRRTAAPEPVEEVEEELDELDDLEEIEEDEEFEELEEDEPEEEEPAPKRGRGRTAKAAPAKAPAKKVPAKTAAAPAEASTGYDSAWLAQYVTEQTGQEFDARAIRMVLRKLAADGTLERLVGEDRSRYSFRGPRDPQVVAVVRYVKSGAAAVDKGERIAAAKNAAPAKAATRAAKASATKAAPTKTTRRRNTT